MSCFDLPLSAFTARNPFLCYSKWCGTVYVWMSIWCILHSDDGQVSQMALCKVFCLIKAKTSIHGDNIFIDHYTFIDIVWINLLFKELSISYKNTAPNQDENLFWSDFEPEPSFSMSANEISIESVKSKCQTITFLLAPFPKDSVLGLILAICRQSCSC